MLLCWRLSNKFGVCTYPHTHASLCVSLGHSLYSVDDFVSRLLSLWLLPIVSVSRVVSGDYIQEYSFLEKVKEKLPNREDYQEFLKCLNIYNKEIISRDELKNLVSLLLTLFLILYRYWVNRCFLILYFN